MVTDDERRDAALRLRDEAAHGEMHIRDFLGALCVCIKTGRNEYRALLRLADLIEPDHVGDSNKMVDRDALLALADEMDTVAASKETDTVPYWYLDIYAEQIREALGASDG